MVISEKTARSVAGIDEGEKYRARRHVGGWSFRWNGVYHRAPMGTRTIVVTDSKITQRVQIGESPQHALDRLNNTLVEEVPKW